MLQSAIKANPFYQPPKQWQIRIFIERNFIAYIDEAFGDIALAILNFEVVEDDSNWAVDIITDISPEKAEIVTRLALLSGMLSIATPLYEVKELHAKDWVREVEASFPPLYVGRFYVHGSHVQDSPPVSKISLEVNAGAAFGSGEHATTSGCLLALTKLAKQRKFVKTLDMGCGSGILALAAAKLWSRPVVAVDIDPFSITVTKENAKNNKVGKFIKAAVGDGYNCNIVRKNAKYDLIIANILANPLMQMSPQLAKNLQTGGVVVLSGLLNTQERQVLNAHRKHGLKLVGTIRKNGWSALILKN